MNRSRRLITLGVWLATVAGAVLSARSDAWFHGALAAVLSRHGSSGGVALGVGFTYRLGYRGRCDSARRRG